MSGAHTPGPWHYQEESDLYTHIVRGPDNFFVCQLQQDTSGYAEANARLIAAAPELLAALKKASRVGLMGHDFVEIDEIIAKAEGRQ
jgi:hypothetical protein